MAARVIEGIEELKKLAGEELGTSDWLKITQERVNLFAEATLDDQWIHTDPERAKETPFGGTIAHGYLTLSLLPHLLFQMVEVKDVGMVINYGLDKLRFPSPLKVGSRMRMKARLGAVEDVRGGVQARLECTVETEGAERPALFAEVLFRYYE